MQIVNPFSSFLEHVLSCLCTLHFHSALQLTSLPILCSTENVFHKASKIHCCLHGPKQSSIGSLVHLYGWHIKLFSSQCNWHCFHITRLLHSSLIPFMVLLYNDSATMSISRLWQTLKRKRPSATGYCSEWIALPLSKQSYSCSRKQAKPEMAHDLTMLWFHIVRTDILV